MYLTLHVEKYGLLQFNALLFLLTASLTKIQTERAERRIKEEAERKAREEEERKRRIEEERKRIEEQAKFEEEEERRKLSEAGWFDETKSMVCIPQVDY